MQVWWPQRARREAGQGWAVKGAPLKLKGALYTRLQRHLRVPEQARLGQRAFSLGLVLVFSRLGEEIDILGDAAVACLGLALANGIFEWQRWQRREKLQQLLRQPGFVPTDTRPQLPLLLELRHQRGVPAHPPVQMRPLTANRAGDDRVTLEAAASLAQSNLERPTWESCSRVLWHIGDACVLS